MVKKKKASAAPRRTYTVLDDVFTLLQTHTVTDTAKLLGVDRRTVQRWKNQGVQPSRPNREVLNDFAFRTRRQIRRHRKAPSQRFPEPEKPLRVPIVGQRRYRRTRVSKAEWDKLKERAGRDPKFRNDRFERRKNKKTKRWEYFRLQDTGSVVFDVLTTREQDVFNLMMGYRGRGLIFNIVFIVGQSYRLRNGDTVEAGTRSATPFQQLDEVTFSPERLLEFLADIRKRGRLAYVRIVFGR